MRGPPKSLNRHRRFPICFQNNDYSFFGSGRSKVHNRYLVIEPDLFRDFHGNRVSSDGVDDDAIPMLAEAIGSKSCHYHRVLAISL